MEFIGMLIGVGTVAGTIYGSYRLFVALLVRVTRRHVDGHGSGARQAAVVRRRGEETSRALGLQRRRTRRRFRLRRPNGEGVRRVEVNRLESSARKQDSRFRILSVLRLRRARAWLRAYYPLHPPSDEFTIAIPKVPQGAGGAFLATLVADDCANHVYSIDLRP
jgi:hypothetical protein